MLFIFFGGREDMSVKIAQQGGGGGGGGGGNCYHEPIIFSPL